MNALEDTPDLHDYHLKTKEWCAEKRRAILRVIGMVRPKGVTPEHVGTHRECADMVIRAACHIYCMTEPIRNAKYCLEKGDSETALKLINWWLKKHEE